MKTTSCLPLKPKRLLHLRFCCTAIITGSIFSVHAQPINTGAIRPGSAADIALGGAVFTWNNPIGAEVAGGTTASTTGLGILAGTSHYLELTNFGFNVPAGATITGITATISRYATGLGLTSVKDNVVQLAGVTSSNLAATGVNWPGALTAATYGSSSNLWGASLTPAIVNSASFGLDLSVTLSGLTLAPTANVDAVTLNVTYSQPVTLALQLRQWTVIHQGDANVLTWSGPLAEPGDTTAASRYIIQRSRDGKEWQNVTTIDGDPGQDSYSYTDQGPFAPGPLYYRLELNQIDAAPVWSAIQVVSVQSIPTISLYPNPCRDLLTISAGRPFTRLVLNDLRGNVLFRATYGTGANSAIIPIAGVAPGLYFVQVDGMTYQVIRD